MECHLPLILFTVSLTLLKGVVGYPGQQSLCPVNEIYTECVISCNDCVTKGNCYQYACYPGCDCVYGFYRNPKGECVPEELCQVYNCPVNEEYSECKVTCDDCRVRGACHLESCNEGCNCIPGYFRNEAGICVPKAYCPPAHTCGRDEIFYDCVPTCKNTCENYYIDGPCLLYCKQGCHCRPGLVKNKLGVCVETRFCPKQNCSINEIYTDCVQPCNKCSERKDCAIFYDCVPGCDCKPRFYKNKRGVCVPERECDDKRRCTNPDEEFYSCIPFCTNTCDRHRLNKPCPDLCRPGCFCRRGLLRNRQGKCVPPHLCEDITCPKYQEISNCPTPCTACKYVDKGCPIKVECRRGCDCIQGYYKNDELECIPKEQCKKEPGPVCPHPKHEFYPCMLSCTNTCEAYLLNKPCVNLPCRPGCFCRKGLLENRQGI